MSPAQDPGSFAHRGPIRKYKHKAEAGSGGKARPKPRHLRLWLVTRAVVQSRPRPAFTTSGMPKARKGSIGKNKLFPQKLTKKTKDREPNSVIPPLLVGRLDQLGQFLQILGPFNGLLTLD